MVSTQDHVNAMRVTGRPEPDALVAPWGYGDTLDLQKVPDSIRFLVDHIKESENWAVGKLSDITIDRRENRSLSRCWMLTLPHHTSHITHYTSLLTVLRTVDPFRRGMHTSYVSRHTSHITQHTSRIAHFH